MQGMVSCCCSCYSQWVTVMGLSPLTPSLITNDDIVAHSPSGPEALLPPTPLTGIPQAADCWQLRQCSGEKLIALAWLVPCMWG